MRIKSSVMLGILLSFMTLCATRADNLLTSKAYVDAHDALKQDKIPAGTTGNVVTYNGESNGQAQFDELAVFPASGTYNAGTDADKLATMGAVMASMASSGSQPALSGTSGAIVIYGGAPGVTYEKLITQTVDCVFGMGDGCGYIGNEYIPDAAAVHGALHNVWTGIDNIQMDMTSLEIRLAELINANNPLLYGTNGAVVTYTNTPGVTGERLILDGSYYEEDADKLVTAGQIYGTVNYIGNRPISVMECTDPTASDDECLLWHISQRRILSAQEGYTFQSVPFINSDDYPSYPPYNP